MAIHAPNLATVTTTLLFRSRQLQNDTRENERERERERERGHEVYLAIARVTARVEPFHLSTCSVRTSDRDRHQHGMNVALVSLL